MEKERIKIVKGFGDYTGSGPWVNKGETYTYVTDSEKFGDGAEHTVIVQRESDEKFFKFEWCWFPSCGDYEFGDELIEVKPEVSVKYV